MFVREKQRERKTETVRKTGRWRRKEGGQKK